MYVITFYSFKGGVGRTLSLANVGVHLALQGKSVLLVDFDLEAPGLDSFPAFNADRKVPGIVEFVTAYMESGVAPIARDYVADCNKKGLTGGKLMLMRSGIAGRDYSTRLSRIDWQKLYSEHDGYLLFEDLKAQWRDQLRPDYVLIDSRTGHTDVGGICTRQLPDAVVACFLPNEENLRGLETVAADIRNESGSPDGHPIDLHFVVSNLPYLDDEKGILARCLRDAKERLVFERPSATVHRYESLSLLNNQIFVQHRSSTRLAKEYKQLAVAVTQRNLQDRDVAIRLLDRSSQLPRLLDPSDDSLSKTLEKIQRFHPNDGEVLYAASRIAKRMGREDEAQALLERAKTLGFRSPEIILDSTREQLKAHRADEFVTSIDEALRHPAADYFDVSRAIELCLQADPHLLIAVGNSVAFQKLGASQQISLCERMLVKRKFLPIAETILDSIVKRAPKPFDKLSIRTSMMICLIGQGKFREATIAVSKLRPDPDTLSMVDAFNYAVAEWGITHIAPRDFFGRVLKVGRDIESHSPGKNVLQCLAISACALGELETAIELLERCDAVSARDSAHSFSGWQYLEVSSAQFRDDLRDFRAQLIAKAVVPQVLREHWK